MEPFSLLLSEYLTELWAGFVGLPAIVQGLVTILILGPLMLTVWGITRYLRILAIAEPDINALELLARNLLSQFWVFVGLVWMLGTLDFVVWVFAKFIGAGAISISGVVIAGAAILSILLTLGSEWLLTSGKEFEEIRGGDLAESAKQFCSKALINAPKLKRRMGNSDPNAFFCGLLRGTVAIHDGFFTRNWTDRERRNVLAHELGHKINGDMPLTVFTLTIVLALELIGRIMIEVGKAMLYGRSESKDKEDKNSSGVSTLLAGLVLIAFGFLTVIIFSLMTGLAKLAIFRQREYMADRIGIALSQDPEGMAELFEKLDREPVSKARNPLEAALFMNGPKVYSKRSGYSFWQKLGAAFQNFFANLDSTHPSLSDRVIQARELIPGR